MVNKETEEGCPLGRKDVEEPRMLLVSCRGPRNIVPRDSVSLLDKRYKTRLIKNSNNSCITSKANKQEKPYAYCN